MPKAERSELCRICPCPKRSILLVRRITKSRPKERQISLLGWRSPCCEAEGWIPRAQHVSASSSRSFKRQSEYLSAAFRTFPIAALLAELFACFFDPCPHGRGVFGAPERLTSGRASMVWTRRSIAADGGKVGGSCVRRSDHTMLARGRRFRAFALRRRISCKIVRLVERHL